MAKPEKLQNGKWRIRWKDENGVRRGKVFNDYEDAKFKLTEYQTVAEKIRRGLLPRSAKEMSFDALCDYWLKHKTAKKRSPKDDTSIIGTHLRPFFKSYKLDSIGQEICDRYNFSKISLKDKTIHNHLTLLISMLNLAFDMGYLQRKPNIKKPSLNECLEYRYLRTREEVNSFINASSKVSELCHDFYLTAILTGMRKGELCGLKWSDIDFEKRIITVQRSFDKPTKSGKIRHIPIVNELYSLLIEKKVEKKSEFVFVRSLNEPINSWDRIFSKDFKDTLKIAGFSEIEIPSQKNQPYIVFHSLRHTFASHWVMNEGDIFKLQKILGHSDIKMTMRYAHLSPQAFKEDYDRLDGIIKNELNDSNVINLF